MAPKLQRIDKNGTKYYVDYTCPKCGGCGKIPHYSHINGGVCYMCSGSGVKAVTWVERTPEYEAKLLQRRLQRARNKSEVLNEEFLLMNGFNQFGEAWIVLGNTFDIKEELKANGAKFSKTLGWTFTSGAWAYDLHKITINDVINQDGDTLVMRNENTWLYDFNEPETIREYINGIQQAYRASTMPETQHLGQIGKKVDLVLKVAAVFVYDSKFGPVFVYKFIDASGNVVVWNTSAKDIQEGKRYAVTGTVKAHEEYKGEKQTVLTRCKYMEVE